MTVKLFFVRPKPENTFQDMPVFLIAAHDEKECWELCCNDANRTVDEFYDYYISNSWEILSRQEQEVGIIWGIHSIKYY